MKFVLADQARLAAESLGGEPFVAYAAKEILHYYILDAMQRGGFLNGLVFHGGTCLRLCYGAPRLSQDLDFSAGKSFEPKSFENLGSAIQRAVGLRFAGGIGIKDAEGLELPGPRLDRCVSAR